MEILSVSQLQTQNTGEEIGVENQGMTKDEQNKAKEGEDENLTPGDMLAFAWQISQGMVSLLRD